MGCPSVITLGYIRLHPVSGLAIDTLPANLIKPTAMLEKLIWPGTMGGF